MDVTAIQHAIHALVEKDTSYPTSGDEDWDLRLALINDAQYIWQTELEITSDAVAKASVAVGGSGYSIGDILEGNSGNLNAFFEVTSVDGSGAVLDVEITQRGTGYATGTITTLSDYGSGCTLAIQVVDELVSGADESPMSDPQFMVYWVTSELTSDEDLGLSSKYLQIAQNKLNRMICFEKLVDNIDGNINDSIGFGK